MRVGVGCGVAARARARVHRFTCTVKESMTELRSPVVGSRSSAPGHTPEVTYFQGLVQMSCGIPGEAKGA